MYGKKTYSFLNLRKWKDFNNKQLNLHKMCVTYASLLGGPWADLWPFYGLYCKQFSPSLKLFLLKSLHFLISSSGYLWSKLCKQLGELKLCMSCAWNFNVSRIYLTYCMEYVWKFSLRIGIFQRATQRAKILLTDNIQSGGSCSVNYH